ncbi:CoaE-domain-containing protein, partial [Pluteus cervinus]
VVGLTGGIATGKSTVSTLLKAQGIPVVDADIIAREVVEPGTPAFKKIVKVFGEENTILLEDGTLDRKKLGSIIFTDPSKRKQLNGIVHPAVRRAMFFAVLKNWVRGERICVLDVPLLIEGGLWRFVGEVVVVFCPTETQLSRLISRDNSSETDASSRLNSQMPITEKVSYANIVLDNSSTREELESQVSELITLLEKKAGWLWRLSWLIPPVGFVSALITLLWRNTRRSKMKVKRGD